MDSLQRNSNSRIPFLLFQLFPERSSAAAVGRRQRGFCSLSATQNLQETHQVSSFGIGATKTTISKKIYYLQETH